MYPILERECPKSERYMVHIYIYGTSLKFENYAKLRIRAPERCGYIQSSTDVYLLISSNIRKMFTFLFYFLHNYFTGLFILGTRLLGDEIESDWEKKIRVLQISIDKPKTLKIINNRGSVTHHFEFYGKKIVSVITNTVKKLLFLQVSISIMSKNVIQYILVYGLHDILNSLFYVLSIKIQKLGHTYKHA